MSTRVEGWSGTGHESHLRLSPEQNAPVVKAHDRAAALRPTLDSAMERVEANVGKHGGELVGREYSLKSLGSFQSKVARKTGNDELTADQVVGTTYDLNRYTLTFPTDQYADGVTASYAQLRAHGFEPVMSRHRNSWDSPDYKGINTSWRHTETGQPVEVQFHTPESFTVKDKDNHLLYELGRARTPEQKAKTPEYDEAIRHLQAERYQGVAIPPGHERVLPPAESEPLGKVSPEWIQQVRADEQALAAQKEAGKHAAATEQTREPAASEGRNPTGPSPPDLFSRGAPRTNQDVVDNGGGLPRTQETVQWAADAGGIDLTGTDVHIVDEPDEMHYLDHQGACACTPAEKGGDEIRLGPASFADEETLVATLAHEKTHVDQLKSGTEVNTETLRGLEDEAYASEQPALERFREQQHDRTVHDRGDLRSPGAGRDPGVGPAPGGHDPGRDDTPGRDDGQAGQGAGGRVPDSGDAGQRTYDAGDRPYDRDGDQPGHGPDEHGVTQDDADPQADQRDTAAQDTPQQDQIQQDAADRAENGPDTPDHATDRDDQDQKVDRDQEANRDQEVAEAAEQGRTASEQRPEPETGEPGHEQPEHPSSGQEQEPDRGEPARPEPEAERREPDQQADSTQQTESDQSGAREEADESEQQQAPEPEQQAPEPEQNQASETEQGGAEQQAPAQEAAPAANYDQQAASDDARVADSMQSDSGEADGGGYESEGASQDYAREER